jgi:hypothetical protein
MNVLNVDRMWRLSCLVDLYTQMPPMRIGQGDYRLLRQNKSEKGLHLQPGDLAIHHHGAGLDMDYEPATYNLPLFTSKHFFSTNNIKQLISSQNRKKLHSMALNPITSHYEKKVRPPCHSLKRIRKCQYIIFNYNYIFFYTYTIIHSI